MSDLVKRLRDLSAHKHDDLSIGDEAADEIERLQLQAEKWANLAADAEAEAVKAQRDAERFRWMVDAPEEEWDAVIEVMDHAPCDWREEIDAAIKARGA